ncbi:MAG: hypothetical protein WBW16_10550 [Bacteroidota bacterium]
MQSNIPVPDLDPVSLPAPVWLLRALLLLTFFLHVIPMNLALGGGFVAAITDWIGRRKNSEHHLSLARSLARILPIVIAFAITLGVAPLLFIQVLYGQFFYTSSILLAWPWLSVIVLLVFSYYGFYLYSFRWEQLQGKRLVIVLASAVLFAVIGFLYTNNLVLMLTPEKWAAMYFQDPHGTHLNFSDPTVVPRFLHFLTASFALAGLLTAVLGLLKRRQDFAYSRWAIRYGVLWFIIATLLQFVVGAWFFLSLPHAVRVVFMGGDGFATAVFALALVCAFASLVMMVIGFASSNPAWKLITGIVLIALTIICMVIIRDFVRGAYLERYFDATKFSVEPQTGVIVLFFLLLVGGLGVIGYMIRKVVAAR